MRHPVAFVDVDTQVDFMRPDGNLYVPGADALVGNLKKLVAFAIERRIPLLQSMDTHVPDDPEFTKYPPHCIRGTPGHEKVPETAVLGARWIGMEPTDVEASPETPLLIEKHVYSLFDNPNTPAILDRIGADEYVVFGVALDVCVRAAALGLRERGSKVVVVTDATAAVTEEGGRTTTEELHRAGVAFATADEVLRKWDQATG